MKGAHREVRHSSRVPRRHGPLRVSGDVEDALDPEGPPPGNLLELPPVLHGADRRSSTLKAASNGHQEVRRPDVGAAEDGGEGQQGSRGQDGEDKLGARYRRPRSLGSGRAGSLAPPPCSSWEHLASTARAASVRTFQTTPACIPRWQSWQNRRTDSLSTTSASPRFRARAASVCEGGHQSIVGRRAFRTTRMCRCLASP